MNLYTHIYIFQQYGDIRMLYTSFKHHGFVTVSYYDIRAAQNAMRALHSKPLGLMKLDVQFSFPKVCIIISVVLN